MVNGSQLYEMKQGSKKQHGICRELRIPLKFKSEEENRRRGEAEEEAKD